MNLSSRLTFTPHLLRVRTPDGDAYEADLAPVMQPKLAVRFAPRAVVQVGLGAMAIAALVLVGTIDVTLNGEDLTDPKVIA